MKLPEKVWILMATSAEPREYGWLDVEVHADGAGAQHIYEQFYPDLEKPVCYVRLPEQERERT